MLVIFKMGSHELFPNLASNCDPPDLSLPSRLSTWCPAGLKLLNSIGTVKTLGTLRDELNALSIMRWS
jgi:hypothetical protein